MSESKFKSIDGTFTLRTTDGGSLTYGISGQRVPDDIAKVAEYVAELVRKVLLGATSDEVDGLKKQIKELQMTIDKKIAENVDLKKVATKAPAKSSAH